MKKQALINTNSAKWSALLILLILIAAAGALFSNQLTTVSAPPKKNNTINPSLPQITQFTQLTQQTISTSLPATQQTDSNPLEITAQPDPPANENITPTENTAPTDPAQAHQQLISAAQAIAHGNFDQAELIIDQLQNTESAQLFAQKLRDLLTQNHQLTDQSFQASQQAYDEYLENMQKAIDTANWRQTMLQASQTTEFDSKEKTAAETELKDQIQQAWLDSLSQYGSSSFLADRMDIKPAVNTETRDLIFAQALQIAHEYIDQEKWLDAYARIYRPLALLDKQSDTYDQTGSRLVRQAIISSMYVPDPNQEAIPWQKRRDGVSYTIYSAALRRIVDNYVDQPDFREMANKALEYCSLLAETSKLSQTFTQIQDPQITESYLKKIADLTSQLASMPQDELGFSHLLGLLRQVQDINQQTLQLPLEVITADFAEGSFAALDGYSYVIWPGDVQTFNKDMTGEFSGIGVEITKPEGFLTVNSLLEGSPAEKAGLDAGDRIIAVDGKSTTNITLEMAVQRITGKSGTDVILTIERDSFKNPKDFTITRQRIVVHTIKGLYRDPSGQWQHFLDKEQGIAYVQVTNFYGETAISLRDTLRILKSQNMTSLILDLRNNSGGFLSSAIQMVDTFISQGTIVSTRNRGGTNEKADKARPENTLDEKLPLVVLVNSNSASASEIVSGALKDHHRALIIGTRTFGKGSVQEIHNLRPTLAQLKMTVAYYYLPSGRRVHHDPKDKLSKDYGVEPHLTLELTGQQNLDWLTAKRQAGILHSNGQNLDLDNSASPDQDNEETDEPNTEDDSEQNKRKFYTAQELMETDSQLKLAWLCLNANLIAQSLDSENQHRGELVGPALLQN